MKNSIKTIKVNGIKFNIGWMADAEFAGPVFEIYKNGKTYGALCVDSENRELGFMSGVYATDEEIVAIKKAMEILNK